MTTKKKQNSKVPKSAKTRLSDMRPKKDARGGQAAPGPGPAPTPPIYNPPSASSTGKNQLTL